MRTVDAAARATPPHPCEWAGCYNEGWRGWIVPDAFAHPAKFSRGLIQRILTHGQARGYWRPGDLIGDPFGGIGCGGIVAAYLGYAWLGVELEPKFVGMADRNFERHARKWEALGVAAPEIVQGDSREFARIVGVDAVVTSPPYAESLDTGGPEKPHPDGFLRKTNWETYGATHGQIGRLRAGEVDAVVTSPPWEDQEPSHAQGDTPSSRKIRTTATGGRAFMDAEYGDSAGQIGRESGETYWEAMAAVYGQCFVALRPGGVMAVVVKDYVKKGARVGLCDDTARLLEAVGFEVIERVRAMLVKSRSLASLFGGEITRTKERKSFFRRLAESKGSPRIDWEEVIFVRKRA